VRRIDLDEFQWVGTGNCRDIAPDVFAVSDEGDGYVLDDDPAHVDPALLARAVASCPMGAISVLDE
jgi:ferredoxin